jgi:hypothetical protein
VTEFARLSSVQTPVAGVVVLAGEALVKVQTLFFLRTPLKQVKLAQLHDLRGVGIV